MKTFKTALLCLGVLASFSAFAKININNATAAEFSVLNGIGAKKAAAIVTYRKEHGNFKEIKDLSKVKGIGPKLLAKIQGDLTLNGKTDLSDVHAKKSKKHAKASKVVKAKTTPKTAAPAPTQAPTAKK